MAARVLDLNDVEEVQLVASGGAKVKFGDFRWYWFNSDFILSLFQFAGAVDCFAKVVKNKNGESFLSLYHRDLDGELVEA